MRKARCEAKRCVGRRSPRKEKDGEGRKEKKDGRKTNVGMERVEERRNIENKKLRREGLPVK